MKGAWADENMLDCIGGVPSDLTTRPLYVLKTNSGLNAYFDSIPALEAGIEAWRHHMRQWFVKLLRKAEDVKIEASDYEKSGLVILSSNNGNLSRECPAQQLPELLAFIQSGCEPEADVGKFLDFCIPICDDAEIITERLLSTALSSDPPQVPLRLSVAYYKMLQGEEPAEGDDDRVTPSIRRVFELGWPFWFQLCLSVCPVCYTQVGTTQSNAWTKSSRCRDYHEPQLCSLTVNSTDWGG